MRELTKVFEHAAVDPRWYAYWEEIGAFRADPESGRPPFSMVLPPPNVTGWLHIGHALNQTLPDVVARWKRMNGHDVLWLPGTDHAGIATQNVVEKQLAAEGKSRHDLGREAFEARVWEWVAKSRGTITSQMRKLGSSVDWSRERFTLDESLSRAVRRVFVTLYEDDLIYRAKYLVSWCPRCRTALSDLEVAHAPARGRLYHIRYPYTGGGGAITVATTRPETMLGDTAVAVHPGDERYAAVVGRTLTLPVIGRALPVIADDFGGPVRRAQLQCLHALAFKMVNLAGHLTALLGQSRDNVKGIVPVIEAVVQPLCDPVELLDHSVTPPTAPLFAAIRPAAVLRTPSLFLNPVGGCPDGARAERAVPAKGGTA